MSKAWYNKYVRKREERVNMCKVVERMMCVVSIVMMVWCACSWCEVVAKNGRPNPEYSRYNALAMMVELGGK